MFLYNCYEPHLYVFKYKNADIEQKTYIIGSIFPEKWTIFDNDYRTANMNLADRLIYQINNRLCHKKKPELELKLELTPAWYPAPESNRHGFPQVFETSASTNSASWAFAY
jgi:hypothetical protein